MRIIGWCTSRSRWHQYPIKTTAAVVSASLHMWSFHPSMKLTDPVHRQDCIDRRSTTDGTPLSGQRWLNASRYHPSIAFQPLLFIHLRAKQTNEGEEVVQRWFRSRRDDESARCSWMNEWMKENKRFRWMCGALASISLPVDLNVQTASLWITVCRRNDVLGISSRVYECQSIRHLFCL